MLTEKLYCDNLRRLELLKIVRGTEAIKIAIYRNHSFEMISNVLNAFLSETKLQASFLYSDYDDSLNFQFKEADLQLIWIDTNRYKLRNLVSFLKERAGVLRLQTKSPILIAYTGDTKLEIDNLTTDCFALYVPEYINVFGDGAYDLLKEPFSGTRLSSKSCLEIARVLGMKYLPALLQTPLKAIVVDLDNTLYKGVLGEDGVDNLVPNFELQQQLKELKNKGFFLCIASKNEEDDAKKMFNQRADFILKWEDFTTYQINWNSKAENIIKISQALNIGFDSILFIDDNPAEIQNVERLGIKTILAKDNISQIIKYYPGLLKLKTSDEDAVRSRDIQANEQRLQMLKSLTTEEYFKKLGIRLEYGINIEEQLPRVAELLNKTNQFILSYVRYNETQVKEFISNPNSLLITIKMSDNLSDSGIIAICLVTKENNNLFVNELTVSCRALGRNLEHIMLPYMFKIAYESLGCTGFVNIAYKKGERNAPALKWLCEYSNSDLKEKGNISLPCKDVSLEGLEVEVING